MGEKLSRIKKFYRFTNEEAKNILIIILIFTFILGFDDGNEKFEMSKWLINLLGSFIIVAVGFLIHVSAQKIYGLFNGIRTVQQISWYGLGIGIIIALISGGSWTVYLPGTFKPRLMSRARIGEWRHGQNTDLIGYIALVGPVANIVLAMIAKWVLFQIFGVEAQWLNNLIMFNFLLAFFTMLPIPGQTGLLAFFGSRLWYVIGLGTILGYVLLFMMGILSLFGALAIGVVVWLVYYTFFERLIW